MERRNFEAELEAALAPDAPWGAMIRLLDSISSLEELEELRRASSQERFEAPLEELTDDGEEPFELVIDYYEGNLRRWDDPKLPYGFKERYPLVTERLDTPEKIRIFLRGADFREVDPMVMGDVFEDILRRHHEGGEQTVVYAPYRGSVWCDALRIVYHTQAEAWALTDLLLPGVKRTKQTGEELHIIWGQEP